MAHVDLGTINYKLPTQFPPLGGFFCLYGSTRRRDLLFEYFLEPTGPQPKKVKPPHCHQKTQGEG